MLSVSMLTVSHLAVIAHQGYFIIYTQFASSSTAFTNTDTPTCCLDNTTHVTC